MSPTYLAVRHAALDNLIEACRAARNFRDMQPLLAEQTSLLRAMYGRQPSARP
jgi:hypothetical protein